MLTARSRRSRRPSHIPKISRPDPGEHAAEPVVEEVADRAPGRPQPVVRHGGPVPVLLIIHDQQQEHEPEEEHQGDGQHAAVGRGDQAGGDEERHAVDPQDVSRPDHEVDEPHHQQEDPAADQGPPHRGDRPGIVAAADGPAGPARSADPGQDDEGRGGPAVEHVHAPQPPTPAGSGRPPSPGRNGRRSSPAWPSTGRRHSPGSARWA